MLTYKGSKKLRKGGRKMLNRIKATFGMYFKRSIFEFNIGSPASEMEIFP